MPVLELSEWAYPELIKWFGTFPNDLTMAIWENIPVLLTDSRGRNLENVTDPTRYPDNKLYFWYSPGDGVKK